MFSFISLLTLVSLIAPLGYVFAYFYVVDEVFSFWQLLCFCLVLALMEAYSIGIYMSHIFTRTKIVFSALSSALTMLVWLVLPILFLTENLVITIVGLAGLGISIAVACYKVFMIWRYCISG